MYSLYVKPRTSGISSWPRSIISEFGDSGCNYAGNKDKINERAVG